MKNKIVSEPKKTRRVTADFQKTGSFHIGCNYWASHAGTNMWHDWRPEVVAKDFKQLSETGLQIIRLFPLWPDFQPLHCLKGGRGDRREMRMGEISMAHDELGRAGISPVMMERFRFAADEASKNNLKLIVGLITGWMSGRLYVPPAFENLDVLTDPFPIMWEIKFVKAFVNHFKAHKAIAAWESGNESNCMGHAPHREAAYLWASSIGNAIKAVDQSRPVISGMHSLVMGKAGDPAQKVWTIEDQADTSDLLTTHPYPLFTPHCNSDPINTIRNVLHATAESRMYGDVGGKPCLVEEIGTLGPMICSEEVAAQYVRASLLSSYANDCRSFIWWCGYDQDNLKHPPYDWSSFERELGIFRKDRKPKPLASTFREIRGLLEKLPELPGRMKEAVCILTDDQDQWAAAYSSFILAKQAGFDLEFQYVDQPLKKSSLYLLPSLAGASAISAEKFEALLDRVRGGAHLYMSLADALLAPFAKVVGLIPSVREARRSPVSFTIDFIPGAKFTAASPHKLELKVKGAEVLGREEDGNPCFTSFKYGKGKVYLLTVPLEVHLSTTPGAFHKAAALPFWKIYAHIAKPFVSRRAVVRDHEMVGITEHPLNSGERVVCMINHSPEPVDVNTEIKAAWKMKEVIRGKFSVTSKPDAGSSNLTIPGNDAVIFLLTKR